MTVNYCEQCNGPLHCEECEKSEADMWSALSGPRPDEVSGDGSGESLPAIETDTVTEEAEAGLNTARTRYHRALFPVCPCKCHKIDSSDDCACRNHRFGFADFLRDDRSAQRGGCQN